MVLILLGATFYDCIIFKPFLDNKMSVFEEYGAFKGNDTFKEGNSVKTFLAPLLKRGLL